MKKIFTLFIALFAMIICANAQYLLQEGFEGLQDYALPAGWTSIDADGDGYDWFTLDGNYNNHSGSASATSASWQYDPLTPDNYLITPAINLTANASLSFWIAAQDADYPDENFAVYISTTGNTVSDFTTQLVAGTATATMTQYTFDLSSYTGQTIYVAFRHYNTTDQFRINLDDVEIFANPTEPTIQVNPAALAFGAVIMPGSKTMTTNVMAWNLTSGITATATAPYTVSADGSNFGATATIAQNGGTLYIKFTPTAEAAANGTITLTNGTLSETITVSGSGKDCTNALQLPYTQDFENGLSECEQRIDQDGDGFNWMLVSECGYQVSTHSGSDALISESWNDEVEELDADNWFITPALAIPSNGAKLEWYIASQDPDYPEEYYEVKVAVAGSDNYTTVFSETLEDAEWHQRTVNLDQFNGQNVTIAFRHHSSDYYIIKLDDISVTAGVGVNEHTADFARVYPNPATNVVNIEASSAINNIEIFNMNGQKINNVEVNDNNTTVNVSSLSNGLYMIKVYTENGVSVQKISVVK